VVAAYQRMPADLTSHRASITSRVGQAALRAVGAVCEGAGMSMVDGALGWLLAQPHVQSLIVGATSPQQIVRTVGTRRNQRGRLHRPATLLGRRARHSPATARGVGAHGASMRWRSAAVAFVSALLLTTAHRRDLPPCPGPGRGGCAAAE
jgi:hypothetical protein